MGKKQGIPEPNQPDLSLKGAEYFSFPHNPLFLAKSLLDFVENLKQNPSLLGYQNLQNYFQNLTFMDPLHIQGVLFEALKEGMKNPGPILAATQVYFEDLSRLMQKSFQPIPLNGENSPPSKTTKDKRFKDEEWQTNPYFDFIKENYLLWDRWVKSVFSNIQGFDAHKQRQVDFYIRQIRDAFAPNNFPWLNPQTLKKTLETRGLNLIQGLENLLKDLEKGKGQLDIQMVDPNAFQVGVNLATTPGKIIYQNDLIQLIQYTPTTKTVFKYPLLIIPPCINKFYIFDLRPENSFIKWLLGQGIAVFIISWINPDHKLVHKTFEDYLFEGVEQAITVACQILKVSTLNALSFCIGGNFLAALDGYYASKKTKSPFKSTTYLATIFDFNNAGDLTVFIDEKKLDLLEKQMKLKGVMDGRTLARTFNLLRANDLVWSFVINNYFLGETPSAFDFFYWNSDSTNLPATMYTYYLRNFYLKNQLISPKGLKISGVPIDIRNIKTPTFFFNTKEDHIAPWQNGFPATQLFSGPKKFILGDSGHIVGVFNPPQDKKYGYWISDDNVSTPDQWLATATKVHRSWWEEWATWLKDYLGPKIPSCPPGSEKYPPLEDAPGSYVVAQPGKTSNEHPKK